jgi:hypothetical protein
MATMDDLQRDLGRLEGTVAAQGERIGALDAKLDAHNSATNLKLDRIIAYQERQKGGFRVLIAASTAAAGVVGAVASMALDWLKGGPAGHP